MLVEVRESSPQLGIVVNLSLKKTRFIPNQQYSIHLKCAEDLFVECLHWDKDTFYFTFREQKKDVVEVPDGEPVQLMQEEECFYGAPTFGKASKDLTSTKKLRYVILSSIRLGGTEK